MASGPGPAHRDVKEESRRRARGRAGRPSAAGAFTPSSVEGSGRLQAGCPTNALATRVYFFVEYAVDNGASGDVVSDMRLFPFADPDRVLLPARFPKVCPAPGLLASIYSYLPLQLGGVVVQAGSP